MIKEQLKCNYKYFQFFEIVVNKEIDYIYFKDGSYHELVFKSQMFNIMHLCGMEYQDPKSKNMMKPSQIYVALKAN
ncbi:hypothetical protein CSV77_06785 [Sporosarcina sp. P16b]|nr:hypothetical protein CSV77_06785 [Sporosarcina sp. P16b]